MKARSEELISLTIVDVAFGGKGVARHEGRVYFVPFTIPGETVLAREVKRKKNFAEAELVSVLVASEDRVEAGCEYFGVCGGCAYQHMKYEKQLELKSVQVEQTLKRVGHLAQVPMRPIIAAPKSYGYRNRIRVHVEGGVAGFYALGSHALVDVEQCAIARPVVNESLRRLRSAALQDGDYSLRAPGGGGPFFEQTNEEVAREMIALAERTVRSGQKLLVDAFCGSGLFAKHLVSKFEKVVGIEENFHAIESAKRSALEQEEYICGDVGEHLAGVLGGAEAAKTTVILDPPATGLAPVICQQLLEARPVEIVYVSCNPGTLARDLGKLCGEGGAYRLESVTPLDMFPQTAEIEVFVHLLLVD